MKWIRWQILISFRYFVLTAVVFSQPFFVFKYKDTCCIKNDHFITKTSFTLFTLHFICKNTKCTAFFCYIHTYIIGHYNSSVRIIDLVFHTTYVLCVNFIHKWRDLQFKINSERQFFGKLFMAFYLLSEFLPEIC